MGEDAGRGLECQKTMDGKVSDGNSSDKAIPSCCLKTIASDPEAEAICHSTVVSGWFSESQSRTAHTSVSLWLGLQDFLVIMICCSIMTLSFFEQILENLHIRDLAHCQIDTVSGNEERKKGLRNVCCLIVTLYWQPQDLIFPLVTLL